MDAYTLNCSFVDHGDPQCDERKRFEEYIKSLWEKGCRIATNIRNYELLVNEDANNLFKVSAGFFTAAIYNTFALATIWLAAFFSDSDSASIIKFLNYCEQNQKRIFTKEFYEEKINVPNSKIRIDMGDFPARLKEARELLNDHVVLLQKLKENRDKIFAHFEKEFLVTHRIDMSISLADLKELLNLAKNIVNKIGVYYDRSIRDFEPLNISDIQQTISIVDSFIKNKKVIIKLKKNGVLI